ncbi:hypothetical protein ACF0H5_014724 [Mactra antiquata]
MSDTESSPTSAKRQKLSASVTELSSEADSSIADIETQKALEDIDNCQNDIDTLNEKASEEILLVEIKYNKLRRPHFQRRNDLIRHIPNFWITAFLNHPRMANIVEEEEEECLHYLKQIDVEEYGDIKSGYQISFVFDPNPYFNNDVIMKEYHLIPKDFSKPKSVSSKIEWKPGMNLTNVSNSKNSKHHRSDGKSFFTWLTESKEPLKDKIAEMIKDDLWPNPLQYYLASEIEVEENGVTDSDDDSDDDEQNAEDDSVVIVGDDDDDDMYGDDDVYEVRDDDDDIDDSVGDLEETVESIEVEDDDDDDDDDDAIEVLGSDSEAELLFEKTQSSEPETIDTTHEAYDTSQTDTGNNDLSSDNIIREEASSSQAGDNNVLDSNVIDSEILTNDGDGDIDHNDDNDSDLLKDDDDDNNDGGGGSGEGGKGTEVSAVLNDSEQNVADTEKSAEDGVD